MTADLAGVEKHLRWLRIGLMCLAFLWVGEPLLTAMAGPIYDDGTTTCTVNPIGRASCTRDVGYFNTNVKEVCTFKWAGSIPVGCLLGG